MKAGRFFLTHVFLIFLPLKVMNVNSSTDSYSKMQRSKMASLLPEEHVELVFRSLFDRALNNEQHMLQLRQYGSIENLGKELRSSTEFQEMNRSSQFWHYHSRLNVPEIIKAHEDHERRRVAGRLVNYLGVVIDPAFLPEVLTGMEGHVEGPPLPANWHADMAEFAGALRAVELAKLKFRVIELGCGWGCWLLNTGVAARNRGLDVELIGVEGDEGHVAFALQACSENRFASNQVHINRGIVGPESGVALFPKQSSAGTSWGLQPVFDATIDQIADAKNGDKYDILPVIKLDTIADSRKVDLLHIDIQGGEFTFVEGCFESIDKYVAYMVIGTHSRLIEGKLMDFLLSKNWTLEIERPAVLAYDPVGKPFVYVDGIQAWKNHRFND